MRLLLDTHALLWWMTDDPALSSAARAAVGASENEVAVSAASVWELAIKGRAGKLEPAPANLLGDLEASGLTLLASTAEHAWAAGALPLHHRDPFDRMLVAQAQLEGYTIVTRDEDLARYSVPVLAA